MVAGSHRGPKLSACLLEVILIFCVSVEGWGLVWCRLALVPMRGLGLSGLGGWWGGGGLVGCVRPRSRARRTRVSPSDDYPAGRLQWDFTCGFDFRHCS